MNIPFTKNIKIYKRRLHFEYKYIYWCRRTT